MATRNVNLSEQQNHLKLKMLRRLATAAFDEIDRGEFETVDPSGIDQFIEGVDSKILDAFRISGRKKSPGLV
ncbi:MAG TPA: hypothetical protein VFC46_10325 [Humisphaera sp.]|nr:hypothetical protein [Humisphaera sp.]